MASSSRACRVWLRNAAGTGWTQILNHTGLSISDSYSGIPQMSVNVYTKDSALIALFTPNRLFRVTKKSSALNDQGGSIPVADGTNEIELFTGNLSDPQSDEKTSAAGSAGLPIIWNLSGAGFSKRVREMVYDPPQDAQTVGSFAYTAVSPQSGTFAQLISTTATYSIINNVNGRSPGSVVAGTIDSGTSHTVKFRQDKALDMLIDLASIGDSTTQFPYRVLVDANASFVPRINFLAPNNASYVFPNGSTGFQIAEPPDDPLNVRVIDEFSECRSVTVTFEKDRIRNKIDVKYSGVGTGGSGSSGQVSSGYTSSLDSQSKFSVLEANVYAPWAQSLTTAQTHRNTILNAFRGLRLNAAGTLYNGDGVDDGSTTDANAPGIWRAEATLKTPEFFSTAFNANIGDNIKILRGSGLPAIFGKYIAYQYDQDMEAVTVTVGFPRMPLQEAVAGSNRKINQAYNSLEVTTALSQSTFAPVTIEDAAPIFSTDILDVYFQNGSQTSNPETYTNDLGSGLGGSSSAGFVIKLTLELGDATISSDGSADMGSTIIPFQGTFQKTLFEPYNIRIDMTSGATTKTVVRQPGSELSVNTIQEYRFFYPFSLTSVDGDISSVTFNLFRDSFGDVAGSGVQRQGIKIFPSIEIYPVPRGTIDTSHAHKD